MGDHAQRVCAPLVGAWTDFQEGRASLLDLSRLADQASRALDNANAATDLEYAFYANESEKHLRVGRRILGPAMSAIIG